MLSKNTPIICYLVIKFLKASIDIVASQSIPPLFLNISSRTETGTEPTVLVI